ncbi:hypothetical protein BGX38DRAFT_1147124 [Terfezia claveryi]|nr:hypothetical protein BGX38DRAFT_1147124 [Terfezia claveryi]
MNRIQYLDDSVVQSDTESSISNTTIDLDNSTQARLEILDQLNIHNPIDIQQAAICLVNARFEQGTEHREISELLSLVWIGLGERPNTNMLSICWSICDIPTLCSVLTAYRRIPQMDPTSEGIYIPHAWHPNPRMHVNCCGELIEIVGSLRPKGIQELTTNPN